MRLTTLAGISSTRSVASSTNSSSTTAFSSVSVRPSISFCWVSGVSSVNTSAARSFGHRRNSTGSFSAGRSSNTAARSGAGRVSITSRKLWYFLASSRFASMVLRVSIEISDIKKLPPFQWQLSFLLFRERKHAPCAFTHSRVCAKQKRRLPLYKIIGEKDCCYCQQVP